MLKFLLTCATALMALASYSSPSTLAMQNVLGRQKESLNGEWPILIDPIATGLQQNWGAIRTKGLKEICYEGDQTLNVPGDWNGQDRAYFYYEGHLWYKRSFNYNKKEGKRVFLHFGAVSMHCDVHLNNTLLGSHKGGFTPFQFEVTDKLNNGENYIIVRVDNIRTEASIPSFYFDWWNYGGITRDVDLIEVPQNYIYDYTIGLKDNKKDIIEVEVVLDGNDVANKKVEFVIPETKLKMELTTNDKGVAKATKKVKLDLWSCENPKLYGVKLSTSQDKIDDKIGFRTIEVKGEDILLNGKSIFLRGINIHEEIAAEKRRSYSQTDAEFLVQNAIDMNCNFIRLSHYAHNEYMVRHAEERGILMWEEIPLWGNNLNFENKEMCDLALQMMEETIERDKNRCGIALWSVSNETNPQDPKRNEFLPKLVELTRSLDKTRLVTSALWKAKFTKKGNDYYMTLKDPFIQHLDVVGLNRYNGWYYDFKGEAKDLKWDYATGKPAIVSEFGSECFYGNKEGDISDKNSWSEGYMEQNYKDNVASFKNFKNLRGTSPWILFDFMSPRRPHAKFQKGWNRKGLTSPEGGRKKAWYVMQRYYLDQEALWKGKK